MQQKWVLYLPSAVIRTREISAGVPTTAPMAPAVIPIYTDSQITVADSPRYLAVSYHRWLFSETLVVCHQDCQQHNNINKLRYQSSILPTLCSYLIDLERCSIWHIHCVCDLLLYHIKKCCIDTQTSCGICCLSEQTSRQTEEIHTNHHQTGSHKPLVHPKQTHPLYTANKPSFLRIRATAWRLVLWTRTIPPSPDTPTNIA